MALEVKDKPAKKDKFFDLIHADKKEVKSRAASADIATVLLRIPRDLHNESKSNAARRGMKVEEYYAEAVTAYNQLKENNL